MVERQKNKAGRNKYTVIVGEKGKTQPVKKLLYCLLAVAAVLLCLYAVYPVAKTIVARLTVETVIARESFLDQKLAVEGVVVRDEQLVRSPAGGTLHILAGEGERVAFGSPVAEIVSASGEKHLVTAPAPGVVCFSLDGWEGELQPAFLENINVSRVKEAESRLLEAKEGSEVSKGSLLCKIINNYTWYFVAEVQKDRLAELEGRKTVSVCLAFAPDTVVSAKVIGSGREKTENIILRIEQEIAGCSQVRFTGAEIITRRVKGIVVPASAVVIAGEETGVYVVRRSVVNYCPVEVVAIGGEQVVVTGISPGMPVIANPGWIKEGQKI